MESAKKTKTDESSSEELEKLRREVAQLRQRQSTFDDLQRRVEEFEERESLPNPTIQPQLAESPVTAACQPGPSQEFEELSEKIAQEQLAAIEALKKWADEAFKVKLIELKKHTYKAMVDRHALVGSDTGNKKVGKQHTY